MNKGIKVSVYCLTYNHVKYIGDALNSFLKQKTSFKYNIFIFDDASNDGTSDIVRRYIEEYPDIISAYISKVNTYGKLERNALLQKLYDQFLPGEYVAWCEGDDYWIDENKLQKQVDFMEKNLECLMTAHAFKIINYADNSITIKKHKEKDGYLSPEEIILQPNGNLATASLVMRKDIFLRRNGFPTCNVEDVPMQLCAINQGKIYYFQDVMSVYRYMHEGSWCIDNALNKGKSINHMIEFVVFLNKYNDYTRKKFDSLIWNKIVLYISAIVETAAKAQIREICNVHGVKKGMLDEINRILSWFNGMPQLLDEEINSINKSENIYIMGKGRYSRYVEKSLQSVNCKVKGFVVSNKDSEICVANLWSLEEILDDKEALLIVGISQIKESEIIKTFQEKHVENYITPLWFRRELMLYE